MGMPGMPPRGIPPPGLSGKDHSIMIIFLNISVKKLINLKVLVEESAYLIQVSKSANSLMNNNSAL